MKKPTFGQWLNNHPQDQETLWVIQNCLGSLLGYAHPLAQAALDAWDESKLKEEKCFCIERGETNVFPCPRHKTEEKPIHVWKGKNGTFKAYPDHITWETDVIECKPPAPKEEGCDLASRSVCIVCGDPLPHKTCKVPRDTYTRAEVDENLWKLQDIINESRDEEAQLTQAEEKEFRKELLGLLMEIITNTTHGLRFQGSKWIVDSLRKRFL